MTGIEMPEKESPYAPAEAHNKNNKPKRGRPAWTEEQKAKARETRARNKAAKESMTTKVSEPSPFQNMVAEMSHEHTPPASAPAKMKTEEERRQAWLDEEIKIEFMNLEEPGMLLKFTYGSTRDKKTYTLFHGGKYDLPRRVVQHIESRQTPLWKFRPNGEGQMGKELQSHKSRFQCRQIFE